MSSILVVESQNDKYFIEALLNHINLEIIVDEPICAIDEYQCIGGIGNLKNSLKKIEADVLKGKGIEQIGIILDADNSGIEERTKEAQKIADTIFENQSDIKIQIFIMNIDGKGELETLLKQIKSQDSYFADCLSSWQECLEDKKLSQKEFDKLWIQFYQRYDCCDKNEKKQAHKKCNNEVSFQKDIYDFDKDIKELNDLKSFLNSFKSLENIGQ